MRDTFNRLVGCRLLILFAALVVVAGCASQPETAPESGGPETAQASPEFEDMAAFEEPGDPLEIPNRFIFAFNLALDVFIFKPAAATYRFLLPEEVRDSVRNFLRNLRTPVVLANDLLQGEWERAETTATRFALNTTVGVLGLFDIASGWGYAYHDEDFGQTLGVYGVGEVVYIVLPILGPSSARDGVGIVVDTFFDPLTYVADAYDFETELLARSALTGVDRRSRNIESLESLQRDAIDFYARVRSLYRQTRDNEIRNGEVLGPTPIPGISEFDFGTTLDDEQIGIQD